MNCNIIDDVKGHPILSLVLQIVFGVFIFLLLCLAITCCKYRKVSKKYLALTTNEDAGTELNKPKTAKAGDEEEKPRKRAKVEKLDKETFGKRPTNGNQGNEEIELGNLDVDFA